MEKAIYLTTERSRVVRTASLDLAYAIEALLYNRYVDEGILRARVDQRAEALRALGIEATMHAGLAKEAYSEPILCAEYVAGQLLELLNFFSEKKRLIPTERSIERQVEEHSTEQVGPFFLMETATMPPRVLDFFVAQRTLKHIFLFLDRQKDERAAY